METYVDEVAAAATKLGLETEIHRQIGQHSLGAWGEIEGQAVRVDAKVFGYREQSYVTMQSRIEPTLDLGLSLKRTMLSLPFGVSIAYPAFNEEHHVSADQDARAQILLTDEVCRAIVAVSHHGGDIDVDDDRALVQQTLGFTEIGPTLYALARVSAAIAARPRT